MADDQNQVKVVFDLDTQEAIKKLSELAGATKEVGKAENVEPLLEQLKDVVLTGSALIATYEVLKKTFEAVFEAESIKAVNQQFEVLTKNAGIAGDALKEAMEKAAGGMADDTDLMKAANRSIIEMGSSAQKLPQLMELARKATAAFGGDLMQNFEGMSQAIASGNMKALKQMGIIVDVKKATKDYADSIGVAENELSRAGQQQALLNAVLEKGRTSFAGVNTDILEATTTFKQLTTTISEIKEVILLAFEKVAGPTIKNFLKGVKEMATDFKTILQANFGEGAEAAKAQISGLEDSLKGLKGKLVDLEFMGKEPGIIDQWFSGTKEQQIAKIKSEIAQTEAQLKAAQANLSKEEANKPQVEGGGGTTNSDAVDKAKRKENEAKFQAEITQLKLQALQSQMQMVDELDKFEEMRRQQKLLMIQEFEAKKLQIEAAPHLNAQRKAAEIQALEAAKDQKILALDEDLNKKRIAVLDNYQKHYSGVMDGIGRGAYVASAKAQEQFLDFGKTGEQMFNTFSGNAATAFTKLGEGTENAGDLMKGFMLNSLADIAQAQGSLLLASVLVNPLGAAAGAGLLVLSGVLRAAAGKHGGANSSSVSAPSGGSSGGGAISSQSESVDKYQESQAQTNDKLDQIHGDLVQQYKAPEPAQFEAPKKIVTIQVQGNYFETEQTKTRLVEMMRESLDATDFKYQQIGGGI